MFGIGGFELFIILLFGFLLFGPDKLPEMAKTLGSALRKFKQAQEEMQAVIKDEVLDPDAGKKKSSTAKPAPNASTESFAERKARYDRERAERLKKSQIDANRSAMKKEAAEKAAAADGSQAASAGGQGSAAGSDAKPAAGASPTAPADATAPAAATASGAAATAASPAKPAAAKPAMQLSPDELFGTKPIKPTPRTAAAASAGDPQPAKASAEGGE